MTKKENKLYTVNKYNKNLFYPGGPISIANNFLQSYKPNPYQGWQTTPDVSLSEFYDTIYPDRSWTLYPKTPTTGINVGPLTFNKTNIGLSHGYTLPQKIDYTKPITGLDFINTRSIGTVPAFQPNTSIIGMDKLGDRGVGLGVTDAKTAADNIVSNNPLTKDMIKGNTDSTPKKKVDWGKIGGMAASAVPDYLYNELDPVYHIADGKESKVGNALNETGINMFKAGAQSGNGWLMLAGAGAKVVGGAYNTLFGAKWNDANINKIKANTTALRTVGNELSQATDNQAVINAASNMGAGINFTKGDIGEDGALVNKVGKEYKKLKGQQKSAENFMVQGLAMGADNANSIQGNNAQRYNTIAFGGPLDSLMYNNDNMGAIEYGFLSDYLTNKNKQADMKNKMPGMTGMPNNMFALGGDVQTHGADYSIGQVYDVTEEEANRLKALGYEYRVIN